MEQHTAAGLKAPRKRSRVIEMQKMLDDRDETIRLLNEALSRALDELARTSKAA
jgi:hypothetical protein